METVRQAETARRPAPTPAPAEPVVTAAPELVQIGPEELAPAGVLTTDRVLDLQRRVGNAVVSRFLEERSASPGAVAFDGAGFGGAAASPTARPARDPGASDASPAVRQAAVEPTADAAATSPDHHDVTGTPVAPASPATDTGAASDRPHAAAIPAGAPDQARGRAAAAIPAPAAQTQGRGADVQRPGTAAAPAAGAADQDEGSQGPRVRVDGRPSAAGSAPAGKRVEPHEDPGFQSMKARAQQAGAGAKAHAPAGAGAAAAQAASAPPAGDVASQAGAAQVEEMAQQQPGTFDRATFIAAVKRAVDAAAPKTLEEADDFKSSGKAGRVKDEVAGLVKGGKKESEKDIKQATEAPPDTSKAQPKLVRPMPGEDPGRPPAAVGAAAAMPAPRAPAETDLSAGPAQVDAQMAEAEVTEPQLAKANEPEFTAAVAARRAAKEHAVTAPIEARKQEQDVLASSRSDAEGAAADQLAGMHGAKVKAFAKALGAKTEAKGADEGKRAKVASELQAIYDKTKAEVTAILAGLDGKVDAAFTAGEQAARQQFEDYVETQMAAYKDRRYSGATGALRWAKDLFFSLPDEVNVFYEQGRLGYLKAMDGVIGQVADLVGAELGAARARIAAGRAEIRKYVTGLAPDLRDVGRDAERKLDSQFDELAADVDSKQNELVDSLAQKYVAARDAVDARIEELKQANRGLVDRATDAIGGVVKTILKLKDMLRGVLAKSGDVIRGIIADPIGFLGKLVDGVKAGLNKFVGKIGTHLKSAFTDWLFGALAGAGIKLPEKLDLAGILDLTMQVLGLTYQSIRARVVKLVGAPVVERMEQVVDVFKTLATKGVGGLWEWIKDKLANLEEMVFGQIKEFLIEKVIKGGITWIISLLNPAAAFIKACKAIYDIIMWIVERGAQLMEFVSAVLDSIGAIVKGNISIVADKVEGALAKALPVAISFLASLLGLGGISEKIKSIIDAVRKPIGKAVDWVITGAVKGFKKTFGGAIGWAKGKYEKGKQWAKGKVEAGKQYVKGKAQGLKDKVTGNRPEDDDLEEDPRTKAGAVLADRLGKETDVEHAQAAVDQVRASSLQTACTRSSWAPRIRTVHGRFGRAPARRRRSCGFRAARARTCT